MKPGRDANAVTEHKSRGDNGMLCLAVCILPACLCKTKRSLFRSFLQFKMHSE